MQSTTNLNLKKPEYTDFADIQDINDNMDTIDDAIHDTQNSVATFTSSDVADGSATSWTTVTKVSSGETHKSIFAKMSQMFKNIRYLYKLLGTTDISSIGNGTVTGGLSSLNDSLQLAAKKFFHFSNVDIPTGYKAIQIFFKGVSTNPILIQDGSGNCFVVLENWTEVNSLKNATVEWINNKNSIQGVACARADASTYRIKITYKSITSPGACLSLDGMCTFLYQQYADQ